jgi:Uncharacterized conserved protein (DUF2190)
MAAGDKTYLESDGKAVNVTLTATVKKDQLVVVEGWCGIAGSDGVSGEQIALSVDNREYQLTVPAGLAVTKGAIIYIAVASITGHTIQDAGYVTAPAAGAVAAFKATSAKDANNVVTGIMLSSIALAS